MSEVELGQTRVVRRSIPADVVPASVASALLDHAEVAACVVDGDGRVVYANAAMAAVTGVPAEEQVGREANGILRAADPAGAGEWTAASPDGDGAARRWEVESFPFADADGRRYRGCLLRDVTGDRDRRDADRRDGEAGRLMREVIDALHTYVVVVGTDGRVRHANDAALRRSNLRAADVVGRPLAEAGWFAHDPAQRERVADALRRAAAGERVRADVAVAVAGPDGGEAERLDVDACFTPFPPGGVLVGGFDVTPARRREREQAAELGRLADVESARLRAIATLGHELRNPLGAALMAQQMLEMDADSLDAETASCVDTLGRNLSMMRRLVEDLMDFNRAALGKLEYKMGQVDLAALVREVAEDQAAEVREAGHRLRVVIHESFAGGCPTEGDAERLKQLACNLLRNGVRYTPPPGTIELRLGRGGESDGKSDGDSGGHSEVVLSVRDDGRGIEPAVLPRLFEPFEQADPSVGGLGIGLALCRQIAHAHGGRLTAHSDGPGRGSVFRLHLPRTV